MGFFKPYGRGSVGGMDITRLNPPRPDLSKGFLKTADLNLGELRVCDLGFPKVGKHSLYFQAFQR